MIETAVSEKPYVEVTCSRGVPVNKRRILAVHAHPDDEASKGAATLAHYAALGHDVMVVTLTGGERGEILNPIFAQNFHSEKNINIATLRREEMARAANILGVHHKWLGFIDSGFFPSHHCPPEESLAAVPLEKAVAALVDIIREFKPHVLITYQEGGDYPHIDHIRTHEISVGAFFAAAAPDPNAWQVAKLYYVHNYVAEKFLQYDKYVGEHYAENPFDKWRDFIPPQYSDISLTTKITTRINCGNYFLHREKALLAHQSQIDPNGPFFVLPHSVQRDLWPTEEYQLAYTCIPNLSGVDSNKQWIPGVYEEDLLAGITENTPGRAYRVHLWES